MYEQNYQISTENDSINSEIRYPQGQRRLRQTKFDDNDKVDKNTIPNLVKEWMKKTQFKLVIEDLIRYHQQVFVCTMVRIIYRCKKILSKSQLGILYKEFTLLIRKKIIGQQKKIKKNHKIIKHKKNIICLQLFENFLYTMLKNTFNVQQLYTYLDEWFNKNTEIEEGKAGKNGRLQIQDNKIKKLIERMLQEKLLCEQDVKLNLNQISDDIDEENRIISEIFQQNVSKHEQYEKLSCQFNKIKIRLQNENSSENFFVQDKIIQSIFLPPILLTRQEQDQFDKKEFFTNFILNEDDLIFQYQKDI